MKRLKTREVNIGGVPLGGYAPIRIQSMTNTPTLDVESTFLQCVSLIEAGAAYVRITAPDLKEAAALLAIKNKLRNEGFNTPLIADIHYKPKVAEYCAHFVEKVRINPGNYVDKKSLKRIAYNEKLYNQELERIAERLHPLISICKEYGTAIRIGTNHGSLSDRIMSRYGDTPLGMVEATMEFLRIFEDAGFYNLVVSLKASNPLIMIEANKLLANKMTDEKLLYPIHLGVTEAGAGEDGRIKSALGIGSLLEYGIGNTIRVSLTENPVKELPFAKILVEKYNRNLSEKDFINKKNCVDEGVQSQFHGFSKLFKTPFPVIVKLSQSSLSAIESDKLLMPDFAYSDTNLSVSNDVIKIIHNDEFREHKFMLYSDKSFIERKKNNNISFIKVSDAALNNDMFLDKIKKNKNVCIIYNSQSFERVQKIRLKLTSNNIDAPLIPVIKREVADMDEWLVKTTLDIGRLLMGKYIDGLCVNVSDDQLKEVLSVCFGILQATRCRVYKTDYISCPSCGRTSFDIESVLKRVIDATNHLKGLKIAVMGCVVNGPGEMVDADYGYVGSGNDKVNLYRGQQPVEKNVNENEAITKLVQLIKSDGRWLEKNE